MTIRYQKRHYEDVAGVLSARRPHDNHGNPNADQTLLIGYWSLLSEAFADLFATDNPPGNSCKDCGVKPPFYIPCTDRVTHSVFQQQDFDREKFLSACGLESEE